MATMSCTTRTDRLLLVVTLVLVSGCATTGLPENMIHPDYSGDALAAERKLAIDHCERENASLEFAEYQNEADMDTKRGLAQQGHRVTRMTMLREAVVACMRRNGWRFP
jgi:hypothetical protein